MACAGFDIGSADCVVAVPKRGTFGLGIEVLQNDIGSRKTPTIVAFTEKQRLIGEEAIAQYIGNAQNSITAFKRLLGRQPNDPELKHEQTFQPYKTVTHSNGRLAVEVDYENRTEQFFPEQIMGAMLQKLRRIAERGLDGQKVTDCVIGVPAWWTDHQRRALLDAANIAGLNVLRLINELTAVAINYQFGRISKMDAKEREGNGKESKVMFFDMGLTATNCSIISFQGLKVNVLSSASDRTLGGRDFDQLLLEHLLGVIRTKYKMDPATNRKAMLKLSKECTRIKQVLSANVKVPYNLEYFMNDKDVSGMVERAEFEALAGKILIPRLYPVIQEALKQAGCTVDQLEAIEVIGGGVRIPIVQKSLEEFLKRPLSKTCDGDESIARGAAWQAALLSPRYTIGIAPQVKDIYPYPISVVWQELDKGSTKPMSDSKMDDPQALFVGNSAIPNTKIMSFYRTDPFQLTAFYPDLSIMPPGTEKLVGKFVVSNAPALYKPEKPTDKVSQPTVKVRLRLDYNGVVSCTAAEIVEEVETDAPAEPKKEEPKKDEAPKTEAPKAEEPKKESSMDTTDDKGKKTEETAAAGAATKRVKKTIRNDLKVETFGTGSLDPATFQSCFEREAQMANSDRIVAETALMRNSLEAYVLEMRNKIQGELKEYIKQGEAEAFLAKLDQMEQWLYDEGQDTQKSEYKKRLDELKSVGDSAVNRRREREGRESFIVALKQAVGRFSGFAQSTDEKYSHIDAEERKKVLSECSAADQWLASSLSKQDKLSLADNPVITCEQIKQKQKDLENIVHPIMNKPKPQPKKEEPKKEEAPKTDAPKAEAEQPKAADPKAKMDTSS